MWRLFHRLFGLAAPPSGLPPEVLADRDRNPVVSASTKEGGANVAASANEGEFARPDYEAFCASFCHRPGAKLMDCLPVRS